MSKTYSASRLNTLPYTKVTDNPTKKQTQSKIPVYYSWFIKTTTYTQNSIAETNYYKKKGNWISEMVSFELDKEIEKDVFYLFMSMGQRKNSEFPWGIEPQTFRNLHSVMLYHWDTETLLWVRSLMRFTLHTSRISNVNSVVFVNRIREVVSFELGEEIKKDVFCLIMSIGQRKTFWVPKKVNCY